MRTIIVATDYSLDGNNAVEYAAGLANQLNAALVLFNAFIMPLHASNTLLPAMAVETMLDENKKKLSDVADTLMAKYSDLKVSCEVAYGDVRNEIKLIFKKYHASLVVVGMRGGSLTQKLFGNTTTDLIKVADFPVLSVPHVVSFKKIDSVLFACDYSCDFQTGALGRLKDLFHQLHARVELFNVEKKINEAAKAVSPELRELAEEGLLEMKTVQGIHVIKSIRDEVKATGADLLIMSPQRYKFWESIVHVSKTGIMASQSTIPMLSVPNRD